MAIGTPLVHGIASNKATLDFVQVNTVGEAVAVGDWIFFCVSGDTGAISATAFGLGAASGNLSLVKDAEATNAGNVVTSIWSARILTADEGVFGCRAGFTDDTDAKTLAVYSVSGLAESSPFDKSSTDTGTGTAPNSGATATLSQAEELIIGACGVEDEVDDITGTWTTGAGNVSGNEQAYGTNGGGDASNISIYAAAEVVAATTAQTAEVTGTDSIDWAAAVATYKAPSGPVVTQPYYVRTGGVPGMKIGRPGTIFGRSW